MTPRKTPAKTPAKAPAKAPARPAAARTPAKKTAKKAAPARTAPAKKAAAARAQMATRAGFVASVEASLGALPLGPGDAAAAHLARAYAAALDRGRTIADREERLGDLGPKLLLTLRDLGGTPAGRHRLLGGRYGGRGDDAGDRPEPPGPPPSSTPGLDALRQAHGRG